MTNACRSTDAVNILNDTTIGGRGQIIVDDVCIFYVPSTRRNAGRNEDGAMPGAKVSPGDRSALEFHDASVCTYMLSSRSR